MNDRSKSPDSPKIECPKCKKIRAVVEDDCHEKRYSSCPKYHPEDCISDCVTCTKEKIKLILDPEPTISITVTGGLSVKVMKIPEVIEKTFNEVINAKDDI